MVADTVAVTYRRFRRMSSGAGPSEHTPETLLFALIRHDVIRRSATPTRQSLLKKLKNSEEAHKVESRKGVVATPKAR